MDDWVQKLGRRIGQTLATAVIEEARGRQYFHAWATLEANPVVPLADAGERELLRPPPHMPTVRPSVPAPKETKRQDSDTLSGVADSAFFSTQASGDASFELMISDELFTDLRCTITVGTGGVCATFHVGQDVNLKRLLEGEAGRLRDALSARGLRSVSVVIEGG